MASAKQRKATQLNLAPDPSTPAGRSALIDEYGRLDEQMAAHKPVEKRHAELRKQILGWYDESDGGSSYEPSGAAYQLLVGPRAERAILDPAAILARIGTEKFLSIVTVSREKLDTVVLREEQSGLLRTERSGSRQLRSIAKVPAAAAAIA